MDEEKVKVFIGYASADKKFALNLYNYLKDNGNFKPWIDIKDLKGKIPTICNEIIPDHKHFIFIESNHSRGRESYKTELNLVIKLRDEGVSSKDRYIYPILLDIDEYTDNRLSDYPKLFTTGRWKANLAKLIIDNEKQERNKINKNETIESNFTQPLDKVIEIKKPELTKTFSHETPVNEINQEKNDVSIKQKWFRIRKIIAVLIFIILFTSFVLFIVFYFISLTDSNIDGTSIQKLRIDTDKQDNHLVDSTDNDTLITVPIIEEYYLPIGTYDSNLQQWSTLYIKTFENTTPNSPDDFAFSINYKLMMKQGLYKELPQDINIHPIKTIGSGKVIKIISLEKIYSKDRKIKCYGKIYY